MIQPNNALDSVPRARLLCTNQQVALSPDELAIGPEIEAQSGMTLRKISLLSAAGTTPATAWARRSMAALLASAVTERSDRVISRSFCVDGDRFLVRTDRQSRSSYAYLTALSIDHLELRASPAEGWLYTSCTGSAVAIGLKDFSSAVTSFNAPTRRRASIRRSLCLRDRSLTDFVLEECSGAAMPCGIDNWLDACSVFVYLYSRYSLTSSKFSLAIPGAGSEYMALPGRDMFGEGIWVGSEW